MSQSVERYLTGVQIDGKGQSMMIDVAGPATSKGSQKRVDFLAAHMLQQLKEFEAAEQRTAEMFEQLLQQLEETVINFQQSFLARELSMSNIYARIDGDRSVGILHLLWHTVSFTARGNTKPMALRRNGREPLFTGRIVALMGDYLQHGSAMDEEDFSTLLEDELASLYIPALPTQPAIMRFRHHPEELFFHPNEAISQFLLKVLEAVCSGGYFHE